MKPTSLRLKINVLVGLLTLAFVAALMALQVGNMRDSVKEEVVAANRVATQLLQRLAWRATTEGVASMQNYLQSLGRVRSNEIQLFDAAGAELYHSPASAYKAGREAPDWFTRLVAPVPSMQNFEFGSGRLVVSSNASRAVLDNWEDFRVLAAQAAALLVGLNVLVFWVVGRAVRPLGHIVRALGRLRAGDLDVALPPLPGREAAAIGAAFNDMVPVLRDRIETERRLSDSRELTRWIDHHIEQERRMIARELHDELGQSVTAIRSLALSVAQRTEAADPAAAQAAQVIAEESSRLYDAMHGLIPRLTPLVLDSFGLGAALDDLAERTRRAHPSLRLEMECQVDGITLTPDAALALYRATQEGITNAIRHGGAHRIVVRVRPHDAGVSLVLEDDGVGLPPDWQHRTGHHGLRWLNERIEGQGGRLAMARMEPHGTRLEVMLPGAECTA